MYMFKIYLLVFFIRYSATSSSDPGIFKKEYLNPKSVDHRKFSGRWYAHMDTLNTTFRDNTFGDVVVLCDERINVVHIIHRWIPSLEECRSTAISFQPAKSDSPKGEFIRMSTNDNLGKMKIRYFDPHPTKGFNVVHRQTRHLPNSYVILSRQRDPRDLEKAIKQVLRALDLDDGDFYVKSKDFGCERTEEKGIKL